MTQNNNRPIIAHPETPPFEHCQRVRTKDGRVLDVSRCEKRVVHGKLRWVVDDLNGERAFADECELFEGVKPEVRYACSKLAAVGHTVKPLGDRDGMRFKVLAINGDDEVVCRDIADGRLLPYRPSALEFVPEVTPVETPDFDFDEAANKAAAAIRKRAESQGVTLERGWISALIEQQIRPGVQQLYRKLQHRRCDTCGANTIDDCPRCGAPQCCPQCCKIDELTRQLTAAESERVREAKACDESRNELLAFRRRDSAAQTSNYWIWQDDEYDHAESLTCDSLVTADRMRTFVAAEGRLAVAMSLLGQSGARMFMLGDYEARLKDGKWSLQKYVMGSWVYQGEFVDPVQAALRAKELADVGKVGAT